MEIILDKVEYSEKNILFRMLQYSLFEESISDLNDMNEEALFEYSWFENYFTEEDREAYFIREQNTEKLLGFVMINTYVQKSAKGHSIAEFMVLPRFRKQKIGTKAAILCFEKHKGNWEVSPAYGNAQAYSFWKSVIDTYTFGDYQYEDGIFLFSNKVPAKKNIYIIGGTMGVGKTTACQILKQKLDNSVFLDGDWCWDAHPFCVTSETKKMVLENIGFLLNNFIHCSAYKNVIFCWVLHEQEILDSLLASLDLEGCHVHSISLVCSGEELRKRLEKDIEAGNRTEDVLERSLARLELYEGLDTLKLDVTGMSAEQTADRICAYQ